MPAISSSGEEKLLDSFVARFGRFAALSKSVVAWPTTFAIDSSGMRCWRHRAHLRLGAFTYNISDGLFRETPVDMFVEKSLVCHLRLGADWTIPERDGL